MKAKEKGIETVKQDKPSDHQLPGYGWTLKKLRRWVEEKLAQRVNRTTLRTLLKQAGLSWKKCKKVLGKAKPEQRAEFVKRFQTWFEQLCQGKLRLIYVDEVHLHQDLEVGYRWSVVGEADWVPRAIAARLWWMLRWLGHQAAAVLDGGWPQWQKAGYPVRTGEELRPARNFTPKPHPKLLAEIDEVLSASNDPGSCLLDARCAERYRGQNETIDPIADHIPGAVSAPYADNLGPDGLFLPVDELRARYKKLLGESRQGERLYIVVRG